MKKIFKKTLKILKYIGIVLISLLILLFIVRFVGKLYYNRTPDGGINETMYVDINGTKQWINIYGQDKDNPVLLYLHGGPFTATSAYDWEHLRKMSNDYTIVDWDQRGCGHNYPKYKETGAVDAQTLIQDGKEMTDFICDYLGREKITIWGNSWGSIFAANLALDYPEKYEKLILSALVVDEVISRTYFRNYLLEQSADDPDIHEAAERFDPDIGLSEQDDLTLKLAASKYIYSDDLINDADFSWLKVLFFSPNCTLIEEYNAFFPDLAYEYMIMDGHIYGDALCGQIPISGRIEYQMPVYIIEGDKDHEPSTMNEVAAEYYEAVKAPDKKLYYLNGGHAVSQIKTNRMAEIIHEIAGK